MLSRLSPDFRTFLAGLLILMLVGFVATPAHGGTISGSFTYPTTFTDGSTLAQSQIASVRVEYGTCAGTAFGTELARTLVAPPATTFTFTLVPPGTYCVRAFTVTTAAAGAQESSTSSVASKTIPFPPPNPPLLTIATTAYELRRYSNGTLRFVQVGTVPRGAPCGVQLVPGYAAFDGATITQPVGAGIIAARCS